jgi:hypothetical protein
MGRDPKSGGSHQTHSFPADKFIPKSEVAETRYPYLGLWERSSESRRIVKKQHHKRSRAWSRKLAIEGGQ